MPPQNSSISSRTVMPAGASLRPGAAAEMDPGLLREPRRLELGYLGEQDVAALGIFVAQVEIDVGSLDRPGADQHALEHAMRIGLEIVAVLEGAGLALVGVDRHQPRALLLAHE